MLGKRFRLALTLIAALLILLGAGYGIVSVRVFRSELARAKDEMQRGRVAAAHRRLARLHKDGWADAELEYELGLSEQAIGRNDLAVAAWTRVAPDSPFGAKAAALRGTSFINSGRFAPAEEVLSRALLREGWDAIELREALARLYRFEGRVDDVRRLVQETWEQSSDKAGLLKSLWEHDIQPWPVDGVRAVLAKADGADDRVWLGHANLATMTGQFDEAKRWLDVCLKKRPDDPAIWRSRLNLAVAANDIDQFRLTLSHLPAAEFTEDEILVLRAWLAARSNIREAELRCLRELLKHQPSNARALEQAAELELQAGRADSAAAFRQRKAAIDSAKESYRKLLGEGDPLEKLPDLVRLAEILGRTFEARGWASLATARGAPVTGSSRRARPSPAPEVRSTDRKLSLADRLSDLLPAPGGAPAASVVVAPPRFRDDAIAKGLNFVFDHGATMLHHLPETMSGGVGVLDYDGDGWLDVYAVQGGPFPPETADSVPGDRLLRNKGDGTFEDVTTAAGLPATLRGYGLGVAVADYDNDGHPDLFLTRWRSYSLFHNRGDGTFEDVTAAAGLDGARIWPTSAAFADLDNDGDLDLYVCHYCTWDPSTSPPCIDPKKDEYIYCDPKMVASAPDRVFRNDAGRFVDVTPSAGIVDQDGRGLGVIAAQLDGDERIDLLVANDMSANYLFQNRGGLRFDEVGQAAGIAGNAGGGFQAGMGLACGDLDGDGLVDVAVTNSYNESTTLYHNLGDGMFADWTVQSGVAAATRYLVGFGLVFLDYDNDGRLDVLSANGNLNDGRPLFPYPMPAQLLAGLPGGRFRDVSAAAGAPWDVLRLGRGLAGGDLDNDGRTDALIVSQGAPLGYLHNLTPGGHWVSLKLHGRESNRDGVGTRIILHAGGRRWVTQRFGGGSYQSANDDRIHIGLGSPDLIDRLEVRWPSGKVDRYAKLEVDSGYDVREGSPTLRRWSEQP